MKINLSSDNAKALWEWKGESEFNEVKQAILADRKKIQKFANQLPAAKVISMTSSSFSLPYFASLTTRNTSTESRH